MTKGVLYYNRGTRCLIRLLVSIHSLRRHYQGAVTIASEGGPLPAWMDKALKEFNAEVLVLPACSDYVLIAKSRLWRHAPFDLTVFLDADTLIRGPIDELFAWTEKHGCVVTKFNDWHTHRGRMRRRIQEWAKVAPKEVEKATGYGWAINTGIMGWKRGAPILPAYQAMTERGMTRGIAKKTLDEIAMQLVVPNYEHFLADSEWNCGCLHSDGLKARIVHYHGHKHCRDNANGDLWKAEFRIVGERFPEIAKSPADDSVAMWLERERGVRHDLTIVSAVNPQYLDRMRANFERWLTMPGLREQKFLIFVNGFANAKQRKFLDRPNVRVVRWDYPAASARETMLAAFILGVAKHVRTPYWMKLDGDATPVAAKWEWPNYERNAITSSKWGYTKMKGDPGATEHWFNRLDKVFSPHAPLFKKLDVKSDFRVSHRKGNPLGIPMRFGSFCHIERTAFTQRIAEVIRKECAGKLPIPSQDTIAWYCAYLWKEKVQLLNMRKWFQP